mgnify:CR=1 FL=1
MKDNSKIAIAAIISGAALETAMVISALPIKKYKAELKNVSKKLNGKIKSTVTRTTLLGICGALTTAAGISLKHKKSETADSSDSSVEAVEMKRVTAYEAEPVETVTADNKATDNKEAVTKDNVAEAETQKEVPESKSVPSVWKCEACGHENSVDKKVCSYCGQLRSDLLNKVLEQW